MGTPVCRIFKPNVHQEFLAEELVYRISKVRNRIIPGHISFVQGALISNKFHYGGTFSWNKFNIAGKTTYQLEYTITYQDCNCKIGYTGEVYNVKAMIIADIIAVWHQDKLMWELVEEHKVEE